MFIAAFCIMPRYGSNLCPSTDECIKMWDVYIHMCVCVCIYIYMFKIYIGEGNGNPLQYACLEDPMDGGVQGVTKSQT